MRNNCPHRLPPRGQVTKKGKENLASNMMSRGVSLYGQNAAISFRRSWHTTLQPRRGLPQSCRPVTLYWKGNPHSRLSPPILFASLYSARRASRSLPGWGQAPLPALLSVFFSLIFSMLIIIVRPPFSIAYPASGGKCVTARRIGACLFHGFYIRRDFFAIRLY